MTEQESMEIIMQVAYDGEFPNNSNEAFGIACKCIEKQIPKEPLDFGDESYLCPCCKRNNFYIGIHLNKSNYCDYCGQAIKWE